jgi:hypothetical protein
MPKRRNDYADRGAPRIQLYESAQPQDAAKNVITVWNEKLNARPRQSSLQCIPLETVMNQNERLPFVQSTAN